MRCINITTLILLAVMVSISCAPEYYKGNDANLTDDRFITVHKILNKHYGEIKLIRIDKYEIIPDTTLGLGNKSIERYRYYERGTPPRWLVVKIAFDTLNNIYDVMDRNDIVRLAARDCWGIETNEDVKKYLDLFFYSTREDSNILFGQFINNKSEISSIIGDYYWLTNKLRDSLIKYLPQVDTISIERANDHFIFNGIFIDPLKLELYQMSIAVDRNGNVAIMRNDILLKIRHIIGDVERKMIG